jgi:hypothetical protein
LQVVQVVHVLHVLHVVHLLQVLHVLQNPPQVNLKKNNPIFFRRHHYIRFIFKNTYAYILFNFKDIEF